MLACMQAGMGWPVADVLLLTELVEEEMHAVFGELYHLNFYPAGQKCTK